MDLTKKELAVIRVALHCSIAQFSNSIKSGCNSGEQLKVLEDQRDLFDSALGKVNLIYCKSE